MNQRCSACGYESAAQAVFRLERDGALGRRQAFCLCCAPFKRGPGEAAAFARTMLAVILLPVGLALLSNDKPIGVAFVAAGTLAAMRPLTIAIHELGHWIAARLVGYRVVRITLGTGPLVKRMRIAGTIIDLRRFLSTGSTLSYSRSSTPPKWRHAVMLLGGVTANALVAGTLAVFLAWHLATNDLPSLTLISVLWGAIVSEAFVAIFNLWPRRVAGHTRITATDGQHLLDLIRAKDFTSIAVNHRFVVEHREMLALGRFSEALERCEQRRRERPRDPMVLGQVLHTLERVSGARAAYQFYRAHVGEIEAEEPTQTAWLKANGAWHALLTDDPSLLAEAGALSEEVFEQFPTIPEMRGTRGAYLTRAGQHERALPMLLEAVRKVEDKIDRADFARFLAECHDGLGKREIAAELRGFSEHLRAHAFAQ